MSEKHTETNRTGEEPEARPSDCNTEHNAKYEKAAEKFESVTPMPKVDLSTFVLSLSSSALVHLGEVPEPETGLMTLDLPMAKHTIDVLSMLEEKTRGNTSHDECRLLKDILFELRMKYVQKVK
jgi:hypothetical protein